MLDGATEARPAVEEVVRAAIEWHFGADTASPYWLARSRSLGFDPLTDITTAADLRRFPDVSEEWRGIDAASLIPRGSRGFQAETSRGGDDDTGGGFSVFESGGTTGAPKRIIDGGSRQRGVRWVSDVLASHGVPGPGEGHWLHIGPSGPHLVGRSIGYLARLRGSLCHYVDFDPRWVRRCLAEQRHDEVARYVDHVVEQAATVLETQPVTTVLATPPVLEAIAARPGVLALFQRRVRALLWSGTSISAESLRVLQEELLPDAVVVGLYGNTMMGIAPQRPRVAGDVEACVFQPFYPFCLVEVVDPDHPDVVVPYGHAGQVAFSLLTRDLFVPWCRERDRARRVAPSDRFDWTGLAGVGPLRDASHVIEGVY